MPKISAEKPKALPHDSKDIGLTDVLKFLIRRRVVLIAGTILGVLVGLLAYIRTPHLFTASVVVEMNRDATSGIGLQDLSGAGSLMGVGNDFAVDMLTQQSVLMGDSTALAVIDRLNLMSLPPYNTLHRTTQNGVMIPLEQDTATRDRALAIFKGGLKVAPVKNTRLLTVSYTNRDPKLAARIANTVVEAYLTNHTKTRYDATAKASTWLTDQLDVLKNQAEDIHQQVSALEKKTGVFALSPPTGKDGSSSESTNSSPEYQRLSNLNQELSHAEVARIEKEAIYRLTQTSDPGVVLGLTGTKLAEDSGGLLSAGSHSIQLIQSLQGQEAALKIRLAADRVKYGPSNPIIIEEQKQIDAIHSQISDTLAHVNADAKADYLLAKSNEDTLRKTVDSQQQQLLSLGNDLSALAFLREEEGSSRRLYQDLYTRLEEANIAAGVRSSGMAVDDPARTPSTKSSPVLKNYIGGGLAIGFLLGLLVGILQQVRDISLNIPEDFVEFSPYPMLGVVPGFDSGKHAAYHKGKDVPEPDAAVQEQAWILRSPKSQLAESYRHIRTSILLSSIDTPPKALLVTSALSGDGKTTTAYNLAVAFAAQSERVLLLEADMRRPSFPRISGCRAGNGLSDVLSGRVSLKDALQQNASLPSLNILTAGTLPPDPAELLGSRRFTELVQELRKDFEYVLIDAPPVIPVTDPVVAAASVDAVIAVVRAGKTTKPEIREMWSALNKPSTHVLGFIVNDFHRGLRSYGYGYQGRGNMGYYYDRGYYSSQEDEE